MSLSQIKVNNTVVTGVDDKPTSKSNNLIRSNGTYDSISNISENIYQKDVTNFNLIGYWSDYNSFNEDGTYIASDKIFVECESYVTARTQFPQAPAILVFDSIGNIVNRYYTDDTSTEKEFKFVVPTDGCFVVNGYKTGINGADASHYYIYVSDLKYVNGLLSDLDYASSEIKSFDLSGIYWEVINGEVKPNTSAGYYIACSKTSINRDGYANIKTQFPNLAIAIIVLDENDEVVGTYKTLTGQELCSFKIPVKAGYSIYVNGYKTGTQGADSSKYQILIPTCLYDIIHHNNISGNEKLIYVGDDINCQFSQIQDAIDSITDDSPSKHYTIIALPKTYSPIHVGTFQVGTDICRYISIIGLDKYNTICLDTSGTYTGTNEIRTNGVIKNLTFIGDHTNFTDDAAYIASVKAGTTRLGYACHLDLGTQDVWIEDCIFRGRNTVAIGAGLHQDEHLRLIRCELYDERSQSVAQELNSSQGVMYLHNMVFSNVTNQNLLIENCKFYGKNDCDRLVDLQLVNNSGSGDIVLLFNTLLKNGATIQNLFKWTTTENYSETLQPWNNEVSRGNNAENMNYSF